MRTTAFVFSVLLAAAASVASAFSNESPKPVTADTKDAFAEVSSGVKAQMETGGRYQYVSPDERFRITQALNDMSSIFERHDTVAAMGENDKIQLYNDQETVNSILTRRDGERVICSKQAPIGSHIPVTTCHSYAQEQEARRNSGKLRDQYTRTQCVDSGHGLCGLGDGNVPLPRSK